MNATVSIVSFVPFPNSGEGEEKQGAEDKICGCGLEDVGARAK